MKCFKEEGVAKEILVVPERCLEEVIWVTVNLPK
jgi:hypothetical protein